MTGLGQLPSAAHSGALSPGPMGLSPEQAPQEGTQPWVWETRPLPAARCALRWCRGWGGGWRPGYRHPSPVLVAPSRLHPRDQRTEVRPGAQTPRKAGVSTPGRTRHVPMAICAAPEPATLDSGRCRFLEARSPRCCEASGWDGKPGLVIQGQTFPIAQGHPLALQQNGVIFTLWAPRRACGENEQDRLQGDLASLLNHSEPGLLYL